MEVLEDVEFAIAPVNESEAKDMVKKIKTHELLEGTRGDKPKDIDSIVDIILRISQLVCDFPEINEFEINPLMVFDEGDGALAVDMRAILKERESEDLLQSSPRSSSIESTTM